MVEIYITREEIEKIIKDKIESLANLELVEFDKGESHWQDWNAPSGYVFVYKTKVKKQ